MNEHDVQNFMAQAFPGLTDRKLKVAIFVCPGFAPVDMIGFHTLFGVLPTVELHLVWKNKELIIGAPTLPIHATTTFDECPRDLDVLFVGAVPPPLFEDQESLDFLADRGSRARWVAGVCGGSLLLGAAGLLRGYRATTNFHVHEALQHFGAIPTRGNVVEDRNRITSGPATGGFEVALRLLQDLVGEEVAREMELQIEYDPRPLFRTGSPELAGPHLTEIAFQRTAALNVPTLEAARRAGARLGLATS